MALYELWAVSGKDSIRSPEFERLFEDVRAGRVNTVVCTSLDRICRSVSDFLHFFEFLSEHDAQFVCLKQQYDTTSPQGRLFVTIMMALAQFEREQTAERTRDAVLARAERGLWNGGRLLGYDLDPERKGYLVPNAVEAASVRFAFESYLRTGSISETAAAMNLRGFRTKAYTSRRDIDHPGREFSRTTVQHLLKNPAYIGQKLIDARGEGRTVDAVWPAIIDVDTFDQAQRLLRANRRTSHSQAKKLRHVHLLGGGLLHCGCCREPMQGRSGTGRLGKTYFYYACTNPDCRLRVVAPEIEEAIVTRIGVLAGDDATVATLIEKANRLLERERPKIERRIRTLRRSLESLGGEADGVMLGLGKATPEAAEFLNGKLADLQERKHQIESGMLEAEQDLRDLTPAAVTPNDVRAGLKEFGRTFAHLRPFEQKELIRLVIRRVEIGDRELVLEIYGNAVGSFAEAAGKTQNVRSGFAEPTIWLPGEDSNLEPSG